MTQFNGSVKFGIGDQNLCTDHSVANSNDFSYQKLAIATAKSRIIGQLLAENEVEPGLVLQYQLNYLERACPEDQELIKSAKVVAGFSHSGSTQYLNPTTVGEELGKITGKTLTAIQVNQLLQELGLQRKVGKEWQLTDKGKDFGQHFPYEKKGHSGYQVRWSTNVINYLKDNLPKDSI